MLICHGFIIYIILVASLVRSLLLLRAWLTLASLAPSDGHGDIGVVFLASLASVTPGVVLLALLAPVTWAWWC